jgi:arylsulfatase A-like enzyme
MASGAERPNILMIAVDDLRPELMTYGKTKIHSPNIDQLAASGVRFDRSYCMVPTCGASRASLFSGVRPAPKRFVSYTARIDQDAPDIVPMHAHFKANGYVTQSLGKILHFPQDSSKGWSEPAWRPSRSDPKLEGPPLALEAAKMPANRDNRGPAYGYAVSADEDWGDGRTAREAVERLRMLAAGDNPFFLAVGFYKPHLPFYAPKKYWDLYDHDAIRLPDNYREGPEGAPAISVHTWGEMRSYRGIPKRGPVTDAQALDLIHGYYACVSYTDAQIGKVLDELDRLGLRENTIVVLWGDHGWNLGEHTMWCKHCVYENSMRAPLIVRAPGFMGGRTTNALTEFVDIYPSLCELTGLEKPSHLEGQSFVKTLRDPKAGDAFAIGRFKTGDTIRTARWRYSEYVDTSGELVGRMLYDHRVDPEENVNVSERPENAKVVYELSRLLRENKGR